MVYTQSGERADFLETLERPLGPGSGRVGTGRGGPWESVWCWAGSGGLETGGGIGGDSFENKSRVGFSEIIQSDRVCLGPKSFSRVFSSHREGFRAQNKGQNIFPKELCGSDYYYFDGFPYVLVVNPAD